MIKLYNDDCFNIMPSIEDESIDLILCDLPYGITSIGWDCVLPADKLWEQYERIISPIGNIVLFSSGNFTIDLINSNRDFYKYKLIWKKNVPTGLSSASYRPMKYYEEICIFTKAGKNRIYNPIMKERVGVGKDCYNYDHYHGKSNHQDLEKVPKRYDPNYVQPSDILEFNVVPNRKGKIHPTQKPVELCEWLVKTYSNEHSIVLDNCMGSGSTGVACINTNRDFIGIELDKTYFDLAKERLDNIANEIKLWD